jgi:hypothetical protein
MSPSASENFSGIFVSYRREDSPGHAGRLFDRLVEHFGRERIFMDIDTIEPGEDFVTVIENAVSSCDVLIAVIGQNWLSTSGTGRLDKPNDFVRLEIATALNRNIRVIPVLVERANMPKPQDLPEDLVKLTRRNAVELSDLRWQTDVDQLISVMERVLAKRAEEDEPLEQSRAREAADRESNLPARESRVDAPATEVPNAFPSPGYKRRRLLLISGALLIVLLATAFMLWRLQPANGREEDFNFGEATLWKRDDTGDVVQIVRNGNNLQAFMERPSAGAAARGRRKGDLAFEGSYEARTIRGTAYLLFSKTDVRRCPAFAGDQRFALVLTLSADGNTLSGSREDYELSVDCNIIILPHQKLTYSKASS